MCIHGWSHLPLLPNFCADPCSPILLKKNMRDNKEDIVFLLFEIKIGI
jgi:predicted nucleic acid-binding Zn ribbon protein